MEEKIISLNKDDVKRIIVEYYSKGNELSVYEELSLCNGNPDLKLYLVEHLNNKEINRILLTIEDIKEVLNNYANSNNHELLDFKYIGGVHTVGYTFNEDTPHYDGIRLIVKEKYQDKKLSKYKH